MDQPRPPTPLHAWRCQSCGRLLATLRLMPGSVLQIKCERCNTLNALEVVQPIDVLAS